MGLKNIRHEKKAYFFIAFVKKQKQAKLIFSISSQDSGFRETDLEQWGNSGFCSAGNILILDLDAKSMVTTAFACTMHSSVAILSICIKA